MKGSVLVQIKEMSESRLWLQWKINGTQVKEGHGSFYVQKTPTTERRKEVVKYMTQTWVQTNPLRVIIHNWTVGT